MLITCWTVKGGSGATVMAASLAVAAARRGDQPALLVDLDGDVPGALGVELPTAAGVSDWLEATRMVLSGPRAGELIHPWAPTGDPAQGDLDSVITRVDEALFVAGVGSVDLTRIPVGAAGLLSERLRVDGRLVVVDGGTRPLGRPDAVADAVIDSSDRSLLVIRPCYLALRHVTQHRRRVDGVILVEEPGRSLGVDDVASVVGAPVVARVRVEPQIARTVDAGLLASRVPKSVESALLPLLGD